MRVTVGRILHYYPAGSSEPLVAIVTRVDDASFQVRILGVDGHDETREAAGVYGPRDEVPAGDHLAWPPRS